MWMPDELLRRRREEIIDMLTDAFARDMIDTAEYEYRVSQANNLMIVTELNALVTDLTPSESRSLQTYPDPGTMSLKAIFSSQEFDGDWLTNDHVQVRAVMGTVICDFRRPVLGPVTRIDVRAVMGEVKIIVPKGMRIQVNVNPILGEVSRHRGDNRLVRQVKGLINTFLGNEEGGQLVNPHSHPTARIEVYGTVIMGSVRIIEKDQPIFS
jgi:hypothetical protein